MRTRTLASWFAFVSIALAAIAPAFAAPPPVVPGEVLVKFKPGIASESHRASVRATVGGSRLKNHAFIGVEHLRIGNGMSVAQAVETLRANPNVQYAEPNYVITLDMIPNDTRFSELWGMRNTGQTGGATDADIDADQAWDVYTGDPNVLIGIIDTGIDYNHPDLAANVWTNPGEIPGNSIDDDNNGYVDDIHGYDFVNNDGDPFDDNGHGSHCAGTIGGVGNNNLGVTGVNWQCKMVGIKFLSAGGSGSTEGAIAGVEYAIANNLRLTSNSWGGGGFSQALLDAINAAGAAGQLFIAAAGNASTNTDVSPHYPSSYDSPFIIAVAATDHNDALASFSNYGLTTVDLGAPGDEILSCQPGGGYQLLSGTSMATPHVAGVAGLAWGRFPAMTPAQCKTLILNHVDPLASLAGRCVTGGRLNALFTIADPDTIPPDSVLNLATTNPGSNSLDLTWTATGDDGPTGRASSYDLRQSTAPITPANFSSATPVPGVPNPQTAGSAESYRVNGLAFSTTYYFAIKALDEYGNAGGMSNVASGTTLDAPDLGSSPDSFFVELLTGASEDRTLTLTNSVANSTLDFSIPSPVILSSARVYPYEPYGKNEADPRHGDPVIESQGGPDGFGYRWIDSDEAGGPAFSWTDISGVGAPLGLTGDDVLSSAVSMGINFPFYGNTFSSVKMSSNGFLTFTDTASPYSNQGLPNSGGATNMVAAFWDDLNMTGGAQIYTYNDGSKFIVQYQNVPRYSGTGTYTFQVLLYPSGEIRYQYLSMTGDLASSTVGIQNATETVGLNVAFNTAYVHDNLAVRIFAIPQWLTATPSSGRITGVGSVDITVHFDATGLQGGNHLGQVTVLNNDPDENPDETPARLHVIGAPDLAVAPTSVDFDSVFIGATPTQNVTVSNPGTDDLHVTGIASSHATMSAAPTSFTLAPSGTQVVTITFAPVAVGPVSASLDIASDDPDSPTTTVTATGTGVTAPSFSVDPESLHVTLNTNQTDSRTVRVTNNGGSNYIFTATALADAGPAPQMLRRSDPQDAELPKGAVDPRTGPAANASGGPDAFGYTYKDSDESGGPIFNWLDIRGVGTNLVLSGDDAQAGPVPIGFNFPFYGGTFTDVRVCTNGWLSFTNSTLTTYTNTGLPNSGTTVPENMLALFWDDLNFGTGINRVYYHSDGSRLVIQYQDVPRFLDTANPNTFEVILYPDGRIVYQYLSFTAVTMNSHTVGIQNAARDDGLQVAFNTTYAHNNLALLFSPPARFLTVSPSGGAIAPGGYLDLSVGFNATGLYGGEYTGRVRINGNDPILPEKNIPSRLTVVGVPDIDSDAATLHYGDVYIGYPQIRQLQIQNTGSDVLHVTNVVTSDPAYGVDVTSADIPAGGSTLVNVTFGPSAAQLYNATLTVSSNDPDTPSLVVTLDGTGVEPPDMQLGTHALSAALSTNLGPRALTKTKAVVIHNAGGSNLAWTAAATVGSAPSAAKRSNANPPVDVQASKDATSTPGIPVVAGSGGPDAFGYRWIDSDESGGPTFSWVEISGVGTPIAMTGDDQTVTGIPLPFAFSFYGNTFNSINACSNGWLSFTSTITAYANTTLPNAGTAVPENAIAPFWDDQDFRTTGDAYTYYDGSRFIIQYQDVPHYATSGSGTYTYEVILYPNGTIDLQYLSMVGLTTSATIGIQDASKTIGLQITSDAAYMHDNLAVRISQTPEWLSVSPENGTTGAGEDDTLYVTFDATDMEDGDYDGNVQVSSNDPSIAVQTTQDIACHLHVGTAAVALDVQPDFEQKTIEHGWVDGVITAPDCTPADISVASLLATGGLGIASGSSPEIAGCYLESQYTRMALLNAIPGGAAVQVEVSGEVPDVMWFLASETMRMLRPVLNAPSGPFTGGSSVPLTWTDGAAAGATTFEVWLTLDGGASWQNVTQNDADHAHTWTVPRTASTSNAYLELLARDGSGYMGSVFSGPFSINAGTTGVGDDIPERFDLSLAGSNPVRGMARFELAMPARGDVDISVYDVRGARVLELARGSFAPGRHPITWDGQRPGGGKVGPGIYFVQARFPQGTARLRVAMIE